MALCSEGHIIEMPDLTWTVVTCFPGVARFSLGRNVLTSCVCVGAGEAEGTGRGIAARRSIVTQSRT